MARAWGAQARGGGRGKLTDMFDAEVIAMLREQFNEAGWFSASWKPPHQQHLVGYRYTIWLTYTSEPCLCLCPPLHLTRWQEILQHAVHVAVWHIHIGKKQLFHPTFHTSTTIGTVCTAACWGP